MRSVAFTASETTLHLRRANRPRARAPGYSARVAAAFVLYDLAWMLPTSWTKRVCAAGPVIGACALGAVFGMHRIAEGDLLQQVAVGRAILAAPSSIGRSSFVEPFASYAYVEDKWLSSVLVALVDAGAGIDGLMLYQLALCTLVAIALYALLRTWIASPLVSLASVALGLVACANRLEPRPDTISLALVMWMLTLHGGAFGWSKVRWLVPLTMLVWVNVHGYFAVGILILVAIAVAAMLGDRTLVALHGSRATATRRSLLSIVAGLAACVVHPQGWRALVSPLAQLRMLRDEPALLASIQEFQSPAAFLTDFEAVHWIVVVVGALALAVVAAPRLGSSALRRQSIAALVALPWLVHPPPGLATWPYRISFVLFAMALFEIVPAVRARRALLPLVFVGFTVLALATVRNLSLIVPVSLVLLAPAWTGALVELREHAFARATWVRCGEVAAVCVLVGSAAWARLADHFPPNSVRAPGLTGFGLQEARFPIGACEFVARERVPGPLFNNFDASGYVLYRLHPERRVFMSSNTSMYPSSFFSDYQRIVATGDVEAIRRRFGTKSVVLDLAAQDTDALVGALATSASWRLVFLDRSGVVYVHVEDETRDLIQRFGATLDERALAIGSSTRYADPVLPRWARPDRPVFPNLDLAVFLRAARRPDLALAEVDRLWAHAPLADLALYAAETARDARTLSGRVAQLEQAEALFPECGAAGWLSRALLERANERLAAQAFDGAREDLERLIARGASTARTSFVLAQVCARQGDAAVARRYLDRALRDETAPGLRKLAQQDPLLRALLQ